MKRLSIFLLTILGLASCVGGELDSATDISEPLYRAEELNSPLHVVFVDEFISVDDVLSTYEIQPEFIYENLNGFAARISDLAKARLLEDVRVTSISHDIKVNINETVVPGSWGIDRSDQRDLPLDNLYTYDYTALGVPVFIADTGIRYSHEQFGGRAEFFYDAYSGNGEDCHGHGTHVAGTVGGETVGISKLSTLYAVRILDCAGSGTLSGVVGGLNAIAGYNPSATGTKGIVNMSLGGGANSTLDDAVRRVVDAGFVVVVSAGNSGRDACFQSPAREPSAVTIAATDQNDTKTSWSNYGSCVDLFAPGSAIVSAGHTSDTQLTIKSGTSMSAPHVAGAFALLKDEFSSYTPAQLETVLKDRATPGVVNNPTNSPNLLLYTLGENSPPPSNLPPVASFSYSCDGLTCDFTDQSYDPDGTIVYLNWTFGDGSSSTVHNPTYTYNASGTYTVTLTVKDNEGAADVRSLSVTVEDNTPPPPPTELTLSAVASKLKGDNVVDLRWTSSDTPVDVYRNGSVIASGLTGVTLRDNLPKTAGVYVYEVCNDEICSNEVTVEINGKKTK